MNDFPYMLVLFHCLTKRGSLQNHLISYALVHVGQLNCIKAYFFILAPDYNMPQEAERKGYLPLYYSTLVGKYKKLHEKENLWPVFYNAMKRHSYDYENESLYEDMKNTFFDRIQKSPKIDENA